MLKRFKQGLIGSLIAASTLASAAYAMEPSCPGASDVKDAYKALNTVMRQSEMGYFVLTAQPAINSSNLSWLLLTQAEGNGFDAAYESGVSEVKSVISPMSDKAIEMQGLYVCAYFTSSGGMSVMAVAQQQQDLVFNPAKINFGQLKIKK